MSLEKRIEELEAQVHDLEKDLIHDGLTNLKTRGFFEEELQTYLAVLGDNETGKRREWFGFRNISLAFFDIDNFKKINDTYGHDTGDLVIQKVAKTIQSEVRTGDTVARWGGEEIVVSLLGADQNDATSKAEKIRQKVEQLTFEGQSDLKITLSAGVASSMKGESLDDLIKRADKALYEAKNGGRNKVVAHGDVK